MSLDAHYFTNGKKNIYYARNSGVTPIEVNTYENLSDIPESIRHYFENEEPTFITPDISQLFRIGNILYPELEKRCIYKRSEPIACIGPGCRQVGEGSIYYCPYCVKREGE